MKSRLVARLTQIARVVVLPALVFALSQAATAGTITSAGGSLSYFYLDPDAVGSVGGTALLSYNDPGPLTALVATDGGAAFPNGVLNVANGGFSELVSLVFDTANPLFSGPDAFLTAIGIPQSPLTDPGLIALLSPSVWQFTFVGSSDLGGGQTLFQFDLVQAITASPTAVPEPSSMALMFAGGAGMLVWKRRRARLSRS